MVSGIVDAVSVGQYVKALLGTMLISQADVSAITEDDSFMDKGILDSTGVLELVGHIEKDMDIRVESDEIIPENLDSIKKVVTFILGKKTKVQ